MPVITRSQSKMLNQSNDNVQTRVGTEKYFNEMNSLSTLSITNQMKEFLFTKEMKELQDDAAKTTGVSDKILKMTKIYQISNRRLPGLIEHNKKKWAEFALTMCGNSYELLQKPYNSVNKEVFSTFTEELIKSRKIFRDNYPLSF